MQEKRKKTREELSKIRSEAAKKGAEKRRAVGYKGVGRKKGWTKDPSLNGIPTRSMYLREPDYKIFSKLAGHADKALVDFMHSVAEGLKARNSQYFKDDGSADVKV